MPRSARIVLPGVPVHVTQRGVDRMSIFLDDDDRQRYCRLLLGATGDCGVAVHAYVLMDNHVHLLMTPPREESLGMAMKRCGQQYAQTFNRRHGRTGHLLQGRFFSSIIESERHLLEVLRYIELNPVRAGMVDAPAGHAWSSVHVHLDRRADPLVQPHAQYLRLGNTAAERAASYADLLRAGLDADRLRRIREHLRQGRALGSEEFQQAATSALGRPVAWRARGRPRRADKETACAPSDAKAVREFLEKGNVPFRRPSGR